MESDTMARRGARPSQPSSLSYPLPEAVCPLWPRRNASAETYTEGESQSRRRGETRVADALNQRCQPGGRARTSESASVGVYIPVDGNAPLRVVVSRSWLVESRFPCRLHARIIAFVPIFDLPAVCTALTVSLASFKDRVEPTATRRPFFLLLYLRYRLPSKSPVCRSFYRRASVGFSSGSIVRVPDPSEIV